MSRDADAILIEKWAASGDIKTPEDDGLTRSTGWPSSYSDAGGDVPSREVFNQMFREITAFAVELNQSGLLPWSSSLDYTHPAFVVGSDNLIYKSVQGSGPGSTVQDPTTDSTGTFWVLLISTTSGRIVDATATTKGIVELATNDEAKNGTDTSLVITPASLRAAGDDRYLQSVSVATESQTGVVELASNTETQAGIDAQRAITPSSLSSRTATDSRTGLVELATNAETQTGTDSQRVVTPASLTSLTATASRIGLAELATNTETQTGTDTQRIVTPAALASRTATTSRRGLVELATNTETQTGTDAQRAVTPASLWQVRTATTGRKGLVELATDAETKTGTDTGQEQLLLPLLHHVSRNCTQRLWSPVMSTPAIATFWKWQYEFHS